MQDLFFSSYFLFLFSNLGIALLLLTRVIYLFIFLTSPDDGFLLPYEILQMY